MLIDMTEAEYLEIMRKADEAQLEHDREQKAKRDAAMAVVDALVSKRAAKDIREYIDECGYTCEFGIVDSHGGHKQDEGDFAFKFLYINQTCNGGYTGDDFSGEMWIPLKRGKYLHFHYSC